MSRPVAVITGASRGIGLAIARTLADAGVDLGLCARSKKVLDPVVRELGARTRVAAIPADVSRVDDVQKLFEMARKDLGPVDWLVNNAGIVERGSLGQLSEEQWDRVIDVNLKGPFLCTQAALPDLIARRGRVVTIGSISGTLGTPRQFAYNASKWGVNGLTLSWAEELREQGVFFACVQPGAVDTDMLTGSGYEPQMQPQEVARIVRFLLTEAPFAMTGALVNAFG